MWFPIAQFGSITELRSGRRWSPAILAEAVAARAAALGSHGLRPGDRVVICQGGSGSFFADLFSVWHAGACAVCISPRTTPSEIDTIARFMHPALLVVGEDDAPPHPTSVRTLCLAREDAMRAAVEPRLTTGIDDDALILLTSGTTGTPKGVVHTFRSLLARLALNRAVIGDDALRNTLCVLPVHFGHGLIGNSLTPLVAGHDLVIASDAGPGVFGSLDRIVNDHAITFMSSVPATWRMVKRFCRQTSRQPLLRAHVGSAPLSAALWQTIIDWCGTTNVVNAYGLTETANWAAGASARSCSPEDGLVGRMWGGSAAVRRDDGTLSPVGEGEIVLQTPGLMRGYFQRPELDAETWHDGWFRTRDHGCIGADGTIRLLGRIDREINRGGTKVQPQDIEQLLERHEQVVEACAFGLPDDILGQGVGVAVVLADDSVDALSRLQDWSAARLSREKLPDRWFVVDTIPKTDRGKTDRLALVGRCLSHRSSGTPTDAPIG